MELEQNEHDVSEFGQILLRLQDGVNGEQMFDFYAFRDGYVLFINQAELQKLYLQVGSTVLFQKCAVYFVDFPQNCIKGLEFGVGKDLFEFHDEVGDGSRRSAVQSEGFSRFFGIFPDFFGQDIDHCQIQFLVKFHNVGEVV